MKIHLFGDEELLESVHVHKDGVGLSITINTVDRWLPFHRAGSSINFAKQDRDTPEEYERRLRATHDCILVHKIDDEVDIGAITHEVEVVIEAENEEEKELLQGIAFSSADDDQITILKVPRNSLIEKDQLATVRIDRKAQNKI